MHSSTFEMRLHQLGQCMHELSNQAQYLQELFSICLQDYQFIKTQEDPKSNVGHGSRKGRKYNKGKNMRTYSEINTEEWGECNSSNNQITGFEGNLNTNNSEIETNKESGGDYFDPTSPFMGIKRPNMENITEEPNVPDANPESDESSTEQNNIYEEGRDINNINNRAQGGNLLTRKRAEPIFVTLSFEEKERIIYDWLSVGISICERKWGINHGVLIKFNNEQRLFRTAKDKAIFLDVQRERITARLSRQKKAVVFKNAEIAIRRYARADQFGLVDFCELGYDRGIAIIASRFHMDLFEYEYLLKELCGYKWKRMDENRWYCSPIAELTKMEILKLSQEEGVDYAAKKTGKSVDAIYRIRQMFGEKEIEQEGGVPLKHKTTEDNVKSLKKHRNYQVKRADDDLITI